MEVQVLYEQFHNVCRFCLSTYDCSPIFLPDKSFNEKLQDGFEIIASKVDENDGLPNNICSSCLRCIVDFISFEATCKKSYEILEQAIQPSGTCSENNETSLEISRKGDSGLFVEYGGHDLDFSELAAVSDEEVKDVLTEQENYNESSVNNDYNFPEQADESEDSLKDCDNDIEENIIINIVHAEDVENTLELHDGGDTVDNTGCTELKVEIAKKANANADSGSEIGEFAESLEHLSDNQKKMFLEAANAKVRDWVCRGVRRIPIVECTFCNKTYRGRNTLRKHLKLHFKIKNYACQYCTRSFSDRSSLRLHEFRHSTVKAFNCNHCDRSYYSQAELKQHLVFQHEERKFVCPVCSAKFPSKTILNDHSRVHMTDRPYICNICGYSFKRNRNLTRHLLCHKEGKPKGKVNGCMFQKSVSCQHCALLFEVPTELLDHMIDQHHQE
uniref:Protein krueppel n=1 Tax=Anopheles atroparvus TaxID=41427 RepID=A0AAG5D2A2_ANOAO